MPRSTPRRGKQQKRERNRKVDSPTACDGYCQCGERFLSTALWERHSDRLGTGHKRLHLIGGEVRSKDESNPALGEGK